MFSYFPPKLLRESDTEENGSLKFREVLFILYICECENEKKYMNTWLQRFGSSKLREINNNEFVAVHVLIASLTSHSHAEYAGGHLEQSVDCYSVNTSVVFSKNQI